MILLLDETVPLPHSFYFCSLCRDVVGTLKAIFLPGVETVLSYWLRVAVQSQHKYVM